MVMPYLEFNGKCEEAFKFYASVFGGEITSLARLNNDPNNPIMHAAVTFSEFGGGVSGADVDKPIQISGMSILVVIPTRERVEQIAQKLAEGGTLVQRFTPHPPPDDDCGGAEVLDRYGYTWFLST